MSEMSHIEKERLEKEIKGFKYNLELTQDAEIDAVYREWELEILVEEYRKALKLIRDTSTDENIVEIANEVLEGD